MSDLQAVLLRFRKDVVGGQGDIAKMFYCMRVSKEDGMCQLFVWQFRGESNLRVFSMSRILMGNMPSTNISEVPIKETAKMEDFPAKYPVAFQALTEDSYMDNTFLTALDHETINVAKTWWLKEGDLSLKNG